MLDGLAGLARIAPCAGGTAWQGPCCAGAGASARLPVRGCWLRRRGCLPWRAGGQAGLNSLLMSAAAAKMMELPGPGVRSFPVSSPGGAVSIMAVGMRAGSHTMPEPK